MNLIKRFRSAKNRSAARAQSGFAGHARLALALAAGCCALLIASGCSQPQPQPGQQQQNNPATANLTVLTPEVLNAPIQTTDGRTIRLADYRGKVVVLDLWATWCPPCREEIPHLVDITREYGGRGVEVIGLTIDARESLQTINNYAQNLNINYAVGLPESVVGPTMTRERGGVIPQTYIITRDGRILTRFVGFDPARSAPQLRAAVERAVNTQ